MAISYDLTTRVDQLLNQLEQPYLKTINPTFAIRPTHAIKILYRQVEQGIRVLKKVRASEAEDLKWIQDMGNLLWNTYRIEAKKIDDFAKAYGLSIEDHPTDVPADLLEVCMADEELIEDPLLVPGDSLEVGGVGDSTISDISPYLGFETERPEGPPF